MSYNALRFLGSPRFRSLPLLILIVFDGRNLDPLGWPFPQPGGPLHWRRDDLRGARNRRADPLWSHGHVAPSWDQVFGLPKSLVDHWFDLGSTVDVQSLGCTFEVPMIDIL